jgi:3-oxoacyl-[acyl-carrier-protein] synthase II
MRRVVITGIGLVTPLGDGVDTNWRSLLDCKSGISKISRFDASDLTCQVGGEIPGADEQGGFKPTDYVPFKDQKKMDKFILYGMSAAIQAVEDSGWKPEAQEDLDATGVLIGSGIGGLPGIEAMSIMIHEKGPKRVSPFFIPASLINLVSGNLSIKYRFSGPNHSVVTACSTGAHAIGDAAKLIASGDVNVMVAGGTEGAICKVGMAGFAAARALSTSYNDTPEKASRPWDRGRDGFVMGEGAGIVVLEELEHAKKRGAKIYAELIGYGLTGDGYHITSPHPEGRGGYRSMEMALKKAKIDLSEVDYVNAHGTSTPMGDEIELKAVKRLFKDHVSNMSMSSTKSSIGHLLGAAGSVEAIYSILAINNNVAPPTLNLDDPIDSLGIDLVPNEPKEKEINTVLSNSFGFGGTNATLVITKFR